MSTEHIYDAPRDMRLLLSVAEQLKTPLTVLARQAELAVRDSQSPLSPAAVQSQAMAALALVDHYLLGLQLLARQQRLDLEPVSISSTLADTAYALEQFARQYGVNVELAVAGRYGPVMAHHTALRAALLSLGLALVEAASQQPSVRHLTLAVHRTSQGVVAGLYGFKDVAAADWRRALRLQGQSRQSFPALSGGPAAGIFVADALGRAMDSQLRVGKHARLTGLAMTFQPSQQLQLI